MSIFISETGRSFPNIDAGGEYEKTWERPSYNKYESHAHHSGPGTNYQITFNDEGICSGCIIHNEKNTLDWEFRFNKLKTLVKKYLFKNL